MVGGGQGDCQTDRRGSEATICSDMGTSRYQTFQEGIAGPNQGRQSPAAGDLGRPLVGGEVCPGDSIQSPELCSLQED